MAEPELIAETNRLLQRLIDIDAEGRADLEKSIRDIPIPKMDLEVTELETRQRAAMEKVRASSTEIREQEQKYRQELLAELRIQTDLLTRIAERLKRNG